MIENIKSYIEKELNESVEVHKSLIDSQMANIEAAVDLILNSYKNNGKCLFFGNGGSAADAQHLATELVCRYRKNRAAIAAIALTTDTSFITAASNDFTFDGIFERQIQALCKKEDVVLGISTSGNSTNVKKGIEAAKKIGAKTIALLGCDGGTIKDVADLNIIVPSNITARVQECHITIGHIICGIIEELVSGV